MYNAIWLSSSRNTSSALAVVDERLEARRGHVAREEVGVEERPAARRAGVRGQELELVGEPSERTAVDLDDDERARVAPFVEDVVDEPRVTPHRLPQARGVEVRLGRDRVLVVAQLVADVREQLDQRDPEVGDVPLAPVGDEQREAIEQEAAGSVA